MAMFPGLRELNNSLESTTSALALNSPLVGDMIKNTLFTVENILGLEESAGVSSSFPAHNNRESVALAA